MAKCATLVYQGSQVAFLTQHGKEQLVGDRLEEALGCQLVHTSAYDTDLLGTFTNEVARQGSQLDAAKAKAEIGMGLTGLHIGIASEGSFGPDPFVGFTPWNSEVLLWVDQQLGIEVQGFAHGPAQSLQRTIQTLDELHSFVTEANFPSHHLNLRPEHALSAPWQKGIFDMKELIQAFHVAQSLSAGGGVVIENDLRAFSNPTRQALIRQATDDLIQKLRSACPQCAKPGFSLKKKLPGLPCRVCAQPTQLPIGEVWLCVSCTFEDKILVNTTELADPARCNYCNP
jgi:hypothetical protein